MFAGDGGGGGGGGGGLASFFQEPAKEFYSIKFNFKSVENKARLRVARRIREIFKNNIFQKFGGYIERLPTDDAMNGLYSVMICTKALSSGINNDRNLNPLWKVIVNELNVPASAIDTCKRVDGEAGLAEKFIIQRSEEEPKDWSNIDDESIDDTNSLFSFRSHINWFQFVNCTSCKNQLNVQKDV